MEAKDATGGPRPWVVLVLGEPGSGKTLLGTQLARALRIPFLARDDVRTGMYLSAGAWGPRPGPPPSVDDAVEAFLTVVEAMAGVGVSLVAEYVFRDDRPQDLARVLDVAGCVGVLARCDDAPARRAARDRADRLLRRRPVLDALGYASIDEHLAEKEVRMAAVSAGMRTSFDFPVLTVATDHGYFPAFDEIVEFVVRSTSAEP